MYNIIVNNNKIKLKNVDFVNSVYIMKTIKQQEYTNVSN